LYAEAAGGQYAINFVHPKQAQAGSDSNKRRFVLAGAAAAVLLVGAVALGYSELSARDRDIQRLLAEKTDLDRQNRELLPDAERIKALDEWTKTQVNWLDELYDMTDRVPDTEALRLTEFLATSGNPQGRTAREKRGHITLKGVARGDNKAIDYLRRQIESESTFHNLEPSSQAPNRTTFDRQRFPVQFSTGASVEARPPAKYVRELEESTTRRPVRRNGGEQPATEATGTPAVEGGQP
jgi:hypothetical protein